MVSAIGTSNLRLELTVPQRRCAPLWAGSSCARAADMLRRPAFWWGASLAFLPTLIGAAGVSYSGMAAMNAIWRLFVDGDAPGVLMVLVGFLYSATIGVVLPCLLYGAAACLTWQLGACQQE